ncbi:MAG: potassium channel family protein [Draconibacterium sp.]
MNIVTIGLSNFGASLAKILTGMGHDVLGVDKNSDKVEFFKDSITNTICLDASDPHALKMLPLKEADAFVVCIGSDFGVSVMIAALLKKFGVKQVYCRESSAIHLEVLHSIGITKTVNPEYEWAKILAHKLSLPGVENLFSISDTLKLIDLKTPKDYIDETVLPQAFKEETRLEIVAIKRNEKTTFSASRLTGSQDAKEITLLENDILVLAGELKDIRRFLKV